MGKIDFSIVTPEKTVYESKADEVFVSTKNGIIGILSNHIPLISAVIPGELIIKKDGALIVMAVSGGFVEIKDKSRVVVFADSAERAEEIDIERAEKAKRRAEEFIRTKKFADDVEFTAIQAALERSIARIKIAKRRRKY